MKLKQILIDARSKIQAEMEAAINNAIALVNEQDVKLKKAELDVARNEAVREVTEQINGQIAELRNQLAAEISRLNAQCEEAKSAYAAKKVEDATLNVELAYNSQLEKLNEQIDALPDDEF